VNGREIFSDFFYCRFFFITDFSSLRIFLHYGFFFIADFFVKIFPAIFPGRLHAGRKFSGNRSVFIGIP